MDPIDAWYRYPIHVVDDTDELKGKKLIGGSTKKSHEETLTEFGDQLHVAFENLSFGSNGEEKEVTQPDLIKWMKIDRRKFQRYFSDAVDMELTDLRKKENNKKTGKAAVIYRCAEGCEQ